MLDEEGIPFSLSGPDGRGVSSGGRQTTWARYLSGADYGYEVRSRAVDLTVRHPLRPSRA